MSPHMCIPDMRPAGGPALEGLSNGTCADMDFCFHELLRWWGVGACWFVYPEMGEMMGLRWGLGGCRRRGSQHCEAAAPNQEPEDESHFTYKRELGNAEQIIR